MTQLVERTPTYLKVGRSSTNQDVAVTVTRATGSGDAVGIPSTPRREANAVEALADKIVCAHLAAQGVGFGSPSQPVITATVALLSRIFEGRISELDDASVFFGPDGSANIVFSNGSEEADITIRQDGQSFHVSLFDASSGTVNETVVGRPGAVVEFLVRRM